MWRDIAWERFDISTIRTWNRPLPLPDANLFEALPLVLGGQLPVGDQAFQQRLQRRLGSDDRALLALHPADLLTERRRRTEVGFWTRVFDLAEDAQERTGL